MKKILKATLSSVAILYAAGFTTPVSAHDLAFEHLQAAFGASATDVWETTCSPNLINGNTARLAARVRDRNPGPSRMSIVVYKDGQASTATDSTPADVGVNAWSPWAVVNGGDGVYTMIVNHSGDAGFDLYDVDYHCENNVGVPGDPEGHTSTTIPVAPVQDQ